MRASLRSGNGRSHYVSYLDLNPSVCQGMSEVELYLILQFTLLILCRRSRRPGIAANCIHEGLNRRGWSTAGDGDKTDASRDGG
jgi:hypothetical protein